MCLPQSTEAEKLQVKCFSALYLLPFFSTTYFSNHPKLDIIQKFKHCENTFESRHHGSPAVNTVIRLLPQWAGSSVILQNLTQRFIIKTFTDLDKTHICKKGLRVSRFNICWLFCKGSNIVTEMYTFVTF